MAGQWLDVQQAAQELGLSTDAVRKRIARGTLVSEEQDGRRVVRLDDGGMKVGHPAESESELVEELRRHNDYLQKQVEAEREARLRADHIIARLSESNAELSRTVRELEAATSPQQEPTEATEDRPDEPQESAEVSRTDASEAPESGQRRPWWRRIFGGAK